MSDAEAEDPDPANIRVRCCSCAQVYVTSREAFNSFSCGCPVCKSPKAQALE